MLICKECFTCHEIIWCFRYVFVFQLNHYEYNLLFVIESGKLY